MFSIVYAIDDLSYTRVVGEGLAPWLALVIVGTAAVGPLLLMTALLMLRSARTGRRRS